MRISNCIHYKVWGKITPFLNFNGAIEPIENLNCNPYWACVTKNVYVKIHISKPPIRSHVRKSLLTDTEFNMDCI